jgi:hypothetical protein
MSFLDSFKKGYSNEAESLAKRRERSTYKTVREQEQERYDNFRQESDSDLMRKYRAEYTSDDDKEIIFSVLSNRGYVRGNDGSFDRR